MRQEAGNNLCGYYVAEYIRMFSTERRGDKNYLDDMRDQLLPKHRVRAIGEELAGFLMKEVIHKDGEFYG